MASKSIVRFALLSLICVSQVVFIDVTVFREIRPLLEAGFYCMALLTLITCFLAFQPHLSVNRFEAVLFLFLCYQIIQAYISKTPLSVIHHELFLGVCYIAFKSIFIGAAKATSVIYAVVTSTVLLVLSVLVYLVEGNTLSNFYNPNISIFSILLACLCSAIISILIRRAKRGTGYAFDIKTALLAVLLLIAFVIILLTSGRSGWIGLLAAAFSLLACMYSGKYKKVVRVVVALLLIGIITGVSYFHKQASASGRFLIYKISGHMFSENWVLGIGEGAFERDYNHYQASYFSQANIDSNEALLADNVYYAFNDPLQLFVENGVIGGLLFCLAAFYFIRHIYSLRRDSATSLPFISLIICVGAASLFSYPFHHLPIVLLVTICVAYLNTIPGTVKYILWQGRRYKAVQGIVIAISLLLLLAYANELLFQINVHKAKKLVEAGEKNKGIRLLNTAEQKGVRDGKVLFFYARQLYNTGKLKEAQSTIAKAAQWYSSNELYRLSGDIHLELAQYAAAEADYKLSLYMAPNRMESRNRLLDLYLTMKDTAQARMWAHSIVDMPIKIPSAKAQRLKEKAKVTVATLKE